MGYVTRGRGISIHRTDCINIINLPEMERARLIDAEWQPEEAHAEKYLAEIKIYANNRNGLLADISKALTEKNIDIMSMNTRTNRQGLATLQTTFEISGREELNRIMTRSGASRASLTSREPQADKGMSGKRRNLSGNRK